MKKVFAILSVFALTIAFVGLTVSKTAVSASELFTEDPTITENDIPMYIMNSIMTTFPNYYDNATKADGNWAGAARQYPWNETRLQIKQMDADGKYTGKEYAIYFAGATSNESAGAGNNICFYDVDAQGNVSLYRMDGGKVSSGNGTAMDPSLSHLRTNNSEYDAYFNPKQLFAASSSEGDTFYNRVFVFDADGRMIRGLLGGVAYGTGDGKLDTTFASEFCYVDGVVTYDDGTVKCDKVVEEVIDETTGEPKVDEQGQPITQETDQDNYLGDRFLWQWYPENYFESKDFIGVNKMIGASDGADYLGTGWDGTKWDYAWYEESSKGYVCICFLPSENSSVAMTEAQLAVQANLTNGNETVTTRTCAQTLWVPAKGYTYDFGYLDKGQTELYDYALDFFTSGYYYGRTVDSTGAGMAYRATFNFSAKPVYAQDVEVNGYSYQLMDGQNTIEVMQGETIYPAENVVYTGLAKYWQTSGDFTSYKSDVSALDLYMEVNGAKVVQPKTGYLSLNDVWVDFRTDWNTWATANGHDTFAEDYTPNVNETDAEIVANFYEVLDWNLAGQTDSTNAFTGNVEMMEKWSWMFEYIVQHADNPNVDWNCKGAITSPGFGRDTLWGFFAESPMRSISGTWANTCIDWSTGASTEWLDTRSNAEMFAQYAIDTSTAAVDTNYIVKYTAANTETGNSSSVTIKYVVVDDYTPIMTVNSNNLMFTPTRDESRLNFPTIDPYTFVTAYNGRYNGSLKGDDITYKVKFESELDFENPAEGNYEVTATVYSASGSKFTSKKFTVYIEDITAPTVKTTDLVLGYGEYFTASMGITYAYDSVDGNLMNNDFKGWLVDESNPVVNTSKVGKYTCKGSVYDKSGNETTYSYSVQVVTNVTTKEYKTNFEDITAALDENADTVEALAKSLTAIQEQITALQSTVDNVKAQVEEANKGCGKKGALLVEFFAATGLLVVFLKRKH